ncbi:MAG: DUF3276 family protein [Cyclobacteriaceae bacterium]
MEDNQGKDRAEIYSQRVRAGKRTYFFDVKSTRSNDYYLTITESRRRYKDDGYFYEKHKIFLYKEDFNKFMNALQETVGHVKEELMPEYDFNQFENNEQFENSGSNESNDSEEATATSSVDDELKWE